VLREGENVVTLQSVNGPSDVSLVDSIRISYQHSYVADNDSLTFPARPGESVNVTGFSSKDVRVFDVTDERSVEELTVSVDQTRNGYEATVTVPAIACFSRLQLPGRFRQAATRQTCRHNFGIRKTGQTL
jgi:hypothetical protein